MSDSHSHPPHVLDDGSICIKVDDSLWSEEGCMGQDPDHAREIAHDLLGVLRHHPDQAVRERALLTPWAEKV